MAFAPVEAKACAVAVAETPAPEVPAAKGSLVELVESMEFIATVETTQSLDNPR